MQTPTIIVPKANSKIRKHEEGNFSNTEHDLVTLNMRATPTKDSTTDQLGKKTCGKDPNQDLAVYQYFGQNIPPHKVSWVQFMGYDSSPNEAGAGAGLQYEPSRNSFVKLVLSIVLVMLLCTVGFNVFVHLTPPVSDFFISLRYWVVLVTCFMMLILNCIVIFSQCARVMPCNYICLIFAVLGTSIITAWFTARVRTALIMYAMAATIATVMVCVLLACSSFDFTRFLLYVVAAAAAITALGLIFMLHRLITNTYIKPLHLLFLALGTLINIIFIIMDLQMILGGKTVELAEDDYALGAFLLYTSIVNLFLNILGLGNALDN